MSKAATAEQARTLTDIPNIGESVAADLRAEGIATPDDVRRMEPFTVYEQMRGPMGSRHDPCVLDVLLAAHDFMNGGPAQPWWHFTPRRKAMNLTKR
jgi:hypothetical protein